MRVTAAGKVDCHRCAKWVVLTYLGLSTRSSCDVVPSASETLRDCGRPRPRRSTWPALVGTWDLPREYEPPGRAYRPGKRSPRPAGPVVAFLEALWSPLEAGRSYGRPEPRKPSSARWGAGGHAAGAPCSLQSILPIICGLTGRTAVSEADPAQPDFAARPLLAAPSKFCSSVMPAGASSRHCRLP